MIFSKRKVKYVARLCLEFNFSLFFPSPIVVAVKLSILCILTSYIFENMCTCTKYHAALGVIENIIEKTSL
jgi:hypothetical protein